MTLDQNEIVMDEKGEKEDESSKEHTNYHEERECKAVINREGAECGVDDGDDDNQLEREICTEENIEDSKRGIEEEGGNNIEETGPQEESDTCAGKDCNEKYVGEEAMKKDIIREDEDIHRRDTNEKERQESECHTADNEEGGVRSGTCKGEPEKNGQESLNSCANRDNIGEKEISETIKREDQQKDSENEAERYEVQDRAVLVRASEQREQDHEEGAKKTKDESTPEKPQVPPPSNKSPRRVHLNPQLTRQWIDATKKVREKQKLHSNNINERLLVVKKQLVKDYEMSLFDTESDDYKNLSKKKKLKRKKKNEALSKNLGRELTIQSTIHKVASRLMLQYGIDMDEALSLAESDVREEFKYFRAKKNYESKERFSSAETDDDDQDNTSSSCDSKSGMQTRVGTKEEVETSRHSLLSKEKEWKESNGDIASNELPADERHSSKSKTRSNKAMMIEHSIERNQSGASGRAASASSQGLHGDSSGRTEREAYPQPTGGSAVHLQGRSRDEGAALDSRDLRDGEAAGTSGSGSGSGGANVSSAVSRPVTKQSSLQLPVLSALVDPEQEQKEESLKTVPPREAKQLKGKNKFRETAAKIISDNRQSKRENFHKLRMGAVRALGSGVSLDSRISSANSISTTGKQSAPHSFPKKQVSFDKLHRQKSNTLTSEESSYLYPPNGTPQRERNKQAMVENTTTTSENNRDYHVEKKLEKKKSEKKIVKKASFNKADEVELIRQQTEILSEKAADATAKLNRDIEIQCTINQSKAILRNISSFIKQNSSVVMESRDKIARHKKAVQYFRKEAERIKRGKLEEQSNTSTDEESPQRVYQKQQYNAFLADWYQTKGEIESLKEKLCNESRTLVNRNGWGNN